MSERLSLALEFLEQSRQQIDQALELSIRDGAASPRLDEAMRYSVLGGGKRIRPALCLAAARAIGADPLAALAPACALELVHAYSLVHDDLPAMDDDDLRRGRPTVHIAFDEASAILAGDALQTLAFALLAEAPELSDQQRIAMIRELATASGHQGMVGGQAIDLESVGRQLTIEQLESMHRHKTGALIEASVRLGALTSGSVTDQQLAALSDFASAWAWRSRCRMTCWILKAIPKSSESDRARTPPGRNPPIRPCWVFPVPGNTWRSCWIRPRVPWTVSATKPRC